VEDGSPIPSTGASARRRWAALAATAGLPVAAGILYRVPPTEGSLYPPCLFHLLTGLHCPGCGTTRCLHALLHGDLHQAAAYNVLTLCLVPPLLFWAARAWWAALADRPVRPRPLPGWTFWVLLVVVAAFAVLRNLPFAPFRVLAPHAL